MLINEWVRKGYGLDVHGKESHRAIRKNKLIRKPIIVPTKKAQYTKRRHETNNAKVEEDLPVAKFYISDNEVNSITDFSARSLCLLSYPLSVMGRWKNWKID